MNSVTVKKTDLIAKIKENRAEHRAIFLEAVEGYKKRGVELLEEHIAKIKKGDIERVYVTMPVPEDHTSDYDRVITMLEMSVDEEVPIDENSFASYVMDDWAWKQSFLASNSEYSSRAMLALKKY